MIHVLVGLMQYSRQSGNGWVEEKATAFFAVRLPGYTAHFFLFCVDIVIVFIFR